MRSYFNWTCDMASSGSYGRRFLGHFLGLFGVFVGVTVGVLLLAGVAVTIHFFLNSLAAVYPVATAIACLVGVLACLAAFLATIR